MRLSRWAWVTVWMSIAVVSIAAVGNTSKYRDRAAAFGFGAVGAASPRTQLLEAAGQAVSNHPLFESLYIGEPERIVAQTAYGTVSARDLYLYLLVANSPTKPYLLDLYDKAVLPSEKQKLSEELRKAIDDYVFVNYIVPKLLSREQWTDVDEARARVAALAGYQFVYITEIVRPKINIRPADRVKYLQEHRSEIAQPERWRVRYIFMHSAESDPLDAQDAVQKKMEDLRADILRGKIEFTEAARQFSEAPSAAHGGEIPPFRRGELFFYFEEAASRLRPGEVSEVIRGPHGFYILQLIETLPPEELSMENTEQAAKVLDGVTRQVLRAKYLWDLKVLLEEKYPPLYVYKPWDDKRPTDVVGEVAGFRITKGQLLNMYPDIESEDFTRRDSLIESMLKRILEGEVLAAEVTKAGLADNPVNHRMHEFARHIAMVEKLREKYACELKPSRDTVRRFWRENPRLFTPLAMKRVVKVSLAPLNTMPTPQQTLAELERALLEGGGEAPSPIAPNMPPAAAQGEPPDTLTDDAITTSISKANHAADALILTLESTGTDRNTSSPHTTQTSEFLPPQHTQMPTVPWIHKGGAPATDPAAGGTKKPDQTRNVYADSPAAHARATRSGSWYTPIELEPAARGNDSVRIVRRAVPQGTTRQIAPSRLRQVVQSYRSADWQLRYEDYGFVYVEDVPELPREVDQLGIGEYLPPKLDGLTAVTYYVEDARRAQKPSFEEIEPYAYGVWRDVQVMKKMDAARRRGLESARIDYRF